MIITWQRQILERPDDSFGACVGLDGLVRRSKTVYRIKIKQKIKWTIRSTSSNQSVRLKTINRNSRGRLSSNSIIVSMLKFGLENICLQLLQGTSSTIEKCNKIDFYNCQTLLIRTTVRSYMFALNKKKVAHLLFTLSFVYSSWRFCICIK